MVSRTRTRTRPRTRSRSLALRVRLMALCATGLLMAAVSAAPVEPPPTTTRDPCAILSTFLEPDLNVTMVRDCYQSIPYNETEANLVLETLHTLYRDFYVFRDYAMSPVLPKPFTSKPVNILKEFKQLRRKQYDSDMAFHQDVDMVIQQLNDAHANYMPGCYARYLFLQPFELYAPVVDNVQNIRVLQDNSDNNLDDCVVVTIDGEPAMEVIQNYVDLHYGVSKDAGVRFNKALSTMTFSAKSQEYVIDYGRFTARTIVPSNETMIYGVQCDGPASPIEEYRAFWQTYRLTSWQPFTDTETYLANNCYNLTSTAPPAKRSLDNKEAAIMSEAYHFNQSPHRPFETLVEPRSSKSAKNLSKRQGMDMGSVATLVFADKSVAFFQLNKRPTVGVIVVQSHMVKETETFALLEAGYVMFDSLGVTNIILDFSNNGGGYLNFGYDFINSLYPMETKVFESNLRVTMNAIAVSEQDLLVNETDTYYDPGLYLDPATGETFKGHDYFLSKPLQRSVQGQRLLFSSRALLFHEWLFSGVGYPWENNANNIVMMSDGMCGSACGIGANILSNIHGVDSYVVGGHQNQNLSAFSFAGATVYSLQEILGDFEGLGLDPPMASLPKAGLYRIPYMQLFMPDDAVPVEFSPNLYSGKFHLDYTPDTARTHELLWEQVAGMAWEEQTSAGG